ncbi:hypothetical protein SNE40_005117 [Patella caerulea]|uniref:Chitin-binding type-2 domain-containing protein n=1 Tax=Patella caerulea TaxID=87958 RepID=A0AAN8QDC9_PATCE
MPTIILSLEHRSSFTMSYLFLSLLTVLYVSAETAMFCDNKPDGAYEAGCRSFTRCINETAAVIECSEHEVYNSRIEDCDDPKHVPAPCGHMIDCTDKADGHYADLDQGCHTYYTCNGGSFFGHNFCPAGLVFNADNGVCDWEHSVYEPCGILPRP